MNDYSIISDNTIWYRTVPGFKTALDYFNKAKSEDNFRSYLLLIREKDGRIIRRVVKPFYTIIQQQCELEL